MADLTLTWDATNQKRVNSNGAEQKDRPDIFYQSNPDWTIQIREQATRGTLTNKDVSSVTSWSAAVDIDWKHTNISGALTAGFSGAVTSITADGFASTPPTTGGVITLTNGASDTEDVAYSAASEAGGVYTFTVSATLTYTYLENDTCSAENTAPCCRTLNANISSTGAANGNLIVTLDADTSTFDTAILNTQQTNGWFELRGLDGSANLIEYLIFPVRLKNTLDADGGTVSPAPAGNYYTKAQIDAFVAALENGMTYQGELDASLGSYPADPDQGDVWHISTAGTISGTYYGVNDFAVYNGSGWDKWDAPQVDNSTIEINASDQLQVKAAGISNSELAATVITGQNEATTAASGDFFLMYSTATTGLVKVDYDNMPAGSTGGSGITSLNGLTTGTQTFTNDTNILVSSNSGAHALIWSGTLAAARGGFGQSTTGSSGIVELSTGSPSFLTKGIANTNIPPINSTGVADDEYARFTASGLESRSVAEVASDIGSSITTVGAVTAGSIGTTGFAIGACAMTLGSDADGDTYYRSSNVITRLSKGTSGQVMTMNAGATAPEWAAAASGGTDEDGVLEIIYALG